MDEYITKMIELEESTESYFTAQELNKLRLPKKGKKSAKESKNLDKKSGGAKSIEVMKLE